MVPTLVRLHLCSRALSHPITVRITEDCLRNRGLLTASPRKKLGSLNRKVVLFQFRTNFGKIPGAPFAYWLPDNLLNAFSHEPINGIGAAKQGLATGDNGRFLRLWHEVNTFNVSYTAQSRQEAQESGKKWFPCNKGGSFRKWYGNNDFPL